MNFTGEQDVTLAAGGRITLPAPLRSQLESHGIQTLCHAHVPGRKAIALVPMHVIDDWKEAVRKQHSEVTDLDLQRRIFARCSQAAIDSWGRITLTTGQQAHADLDVGSVVKLLGMGNYFEAWNAMAYDEENAFGALKP